MTLLFTLLREVSLREWRLHPWRQGVGVLAVALGVALAFSVHLINESALAEFSSAVRSATGQSDGALQCPQFCDDRVWDAIQTQDGVVAASAVLEVDSYALDAQGKRQALKVLGLDALTIASVAPELLPRVSETMLDRLGFLDPQRLFLNPAALQVLQVRDGQTVELQAGLGLRTLTVAGTVAAGGTALAVMDIAGAQEHFEAVGRISRVELRLQTGRTLQALQNQWRAQPWWPEGARLQAPEEGAQRVSTASRAYRVNLTVLALVALFVGAFLVFSIQSLSVSQRTPSLALLGVMGLSAHQRLGLVLSESLLMGAAGSALGLLLGAGAAGLALRWLAGDLGGGYFPGIAPSLQMSPQSAAVFGTLGVLAALTGGWSPARQAQGMAVAQALKGLGGTDVRSLPPWAGPALVAAGALLALVPPWQGLALAAYAAVACLLLGGMACVPAVVAMLLHRLQPRDDARLVLALGRARHERQEATVAVAGVVASLSLAVALTVMVASFRTGVSQWLDQVLPADLYARTATSSAASDGAYLPLAFVQAAAALEGVQRVEAARTRPIVVDPKRPAVSLVARPLQTGAQGGPGLEPRLPMVGPTLPKQALQAAQASSGSTLLAGYVTEAMEMLYGARPGTTLQLTLATEIGTVRLQVFVMGVWRDYARQFGAVVVDLDEYRAVTGDQRVNDIAIHAHRGADLDRLQGALRALADRASLIEFAVPAQIRALSMRIFDRSFAVTYYLQALAIGIGLFGIAASFSAQVLARRKEFGLLTHLGLTRGQIVGIVAAEGAAWTAAGAVAGLLLGLAVSAVLVHVVNPQSFHWTMDWVLPWPRLIGLCVCVVLAGSIAAAISARAAVSTDAVRSVKEDW
ncbi:MAG: ABC transporter permease [Betaproteobacteria bacterium]|nr:ABC transporter permease [Betaproteobacteria bacterium]